VVAELLLVKRTRLPIATFPRRLADRRAEIRQIALASRLTADLLNRWLPVSESLSSSPRDGTPRRAARQRIFVDATSISLTTLTSKLERRSRSLPT